MEYQNSKSAIDDKDISESHAHTIKNKKILHKLYQDWYQFLLDRLQLMPKGKIVELGSGGGFLKSLHPEVITSDVLPLENVDMVFSAEAMPFKDNELSSIFMIDVLHHIPNCRNFFREANRVLNSGGLIIMSEPANTPLSRFFYKRFHHEAFDTNADWELNEIKGPLSSANGAIPWIVFDRDREIFEKEFPDLEVVSIRLHTPIMYFLAGGLSPYQIIPSFSYPIFKWIENILAPLYNLIAMFQLIVVRKKQIVNE